MRKRVFYLLPFILLICVALLATDTDKRPMTVDDSLNMKRVSSPRISPDGKWVIFSMAKLDWKKNKYPSHLWMVSTEGGEPFQYTSIERDSSPQWSPDGTRLAFLRTTGEKDEKGRQIWIMNTSGGEAIKLTDHKDTISAFRWSRDGKYLVFRAPDAKSKEEKEKEKQGDDAIFVDEGPNGQRRASWSNLWLFDVENKKEEPITKEEMSVRDFDISPDGSQVVLIYRTSNTRNEPYMAEMGLVNIKEGKVVHLTDNQAPESRPRWSPSGKEIAYLAPDDKTFALAESKIWIMDVGSKSYRKVSGDFQGSIRTYRWTPDGKSLLFNAGVRTNSHLFRLDLTTGKITQLTKGEGVMGSCSFSDDGSKVAYTYSSAQQPPDIWLVSLPRAEQHRLTELNPWVKELTLASAQVITWKSKDGLPIEGMLYLPSDYKPGTPLPLILHVHGGPAGVFLNSFRASYHIYAGLGYASLCPNVRGSSGYGDKLLQGNMHDLGGGDYEDLMSGVDEVIKRGIADPEKMGIRGWSYGGILGGWTITQTNRFKAASLGAMVTDWNSEYGQGFNYDVRFWYIGGKPWSNPEAYQRLSSIAYIKNVTTPTLLLHGEQDVTCTIEQSMNFYTGLKEEEKMVRFIRFPREPHGFREPHHQRIRDVEEIAWMQKYIRGIEWKCPPREEKEKKEEEKTFFD
ncbi:hypothetical protein CEE39_04210 [bacterium (candidate division B38) B3_B38]|nr:MAG: hypothetical protein CEE39_04210 [bacterium (candidate division B38) B3_B38]